MELLCLDFVNSVFRDFRGRWERDDLQNPVWLADFLARWQLQVGQPVNEMVLKELVDLRADLMEAIETLVEQGTIGEEELALLNSRLHASAFTHQIEFIGGEYHLGTTARARNWQWVQSEIIVDFITLLVDYDPARIKICQNQHCRYVFYDETKSRTRRYCSAKPCGNLMKMRRYHARQKELRE